MKTKLIYLCCTLFFMACQTDSFDIKENEVNLTVRNAPAKVEVCHYDAETNTYKTLSVNEKALKAHLRHGDTEGPCDILDCDPVCLFCEYLDFMDFDLDEPCTDNPFDGDYYCSYELSCPSGGVMGQAQLWDRDVYSNLNASCNTGQEYDSGVLYVAWERNCDRGEGGFTEFFGQISFTYLLHNEDGSVKEEVVFIEDFGATETYYNLALQCKATIDNMATQLGYSNVCAE